MWTDVHVTGIPIAELLVQRHEMLLIERVLAFSGEEIEVLARMAADHPLAEPRGIPAWVGIELMAQAVSVFSALELRELGEAPRIGLLLGTRKFEARSPYFAVGAPLRVRATLTLRDDTGLGVFDCSIHDERGLVAEAQVKGHMPADIDAFLGERPDG